MPSWPDEFLADIAKRLERWYEQHGRRFPWRAVSDPYVIFATEFLLQRTRAETIEAAFHDFFTRYPTVRALAEAAPEDVRRFFSRLGLLYRGERLWAAAREIVKKHGGAVPDSMEELLKLRGVGVYIASAVLNFGFGVPTPVVDKNVLRVMNRLANIVSETEARRFIAALFRRGDHRRIAYALIDLGALVCTETPRCEKCPLASVCPRHPLRKGDWRMLRKVVRKDGSVRLQEQPVVSRRRRATLRSR